MIDATHTHTDDAMTKDIGTFYFIEIKCRLRRKFYQVKKKVRVEHLYEDILGRRFNVGIL